MGKNIYIFWVPLLSAFTMIRTSSRTNISWRKYVQTSWTLATQIYNRLSEGSVLFFSSGMAVNLRSSEA